MPETADEKQMKLRYAGTCRLCGTDLAARTEAIYERPTKTVRCLTCSPTTAVEFLETPNPPPPLVEEGAPWVQG